MHSYRGHMVQVPTDPGEALPAVVTKVLDDSADPDYSLVDLWVIPGGYPLTEVKLYDTETPARAEDLGEGAWTLDG